MIKCPRCKGPEVVYGAVIDETDCQHCDGKGEIGYGQIWRCWVWESWGGHQALLERGDGCWKLGNRDLNGPEEIEDEVVEPIARLKEVEFEK